MRSLAPLRIHALSYSKPRIAVLNYRRDVHARRPAAPTDTINEFPNRPKSDRVRWGRIWRIYAPIATFGLAASLTYQWYEKDEGIKTLNPKDFTSYTLISKEPVSSTSSLFTLRPTATGPNTNIYAEAWRKGIWSVQIKQPQLQIARSYTPLPPSESDDGSSANDLRFLIRRDPHGELSGYLHKLPLNASLDLRGPQIEYEIPEGVGEVLFLAGGTGIAPALQLVHTLLERESSLLGKLPNIRILWANRRREDALDLPVQKAQVRESWRSWLTGSVPAAETEMSTSEPDDNCRLTNQIKLLKAKYADRVDLKYFVDEEKSFIDESVLSKYVKRSVGTESKGTGQNGQRSRLIVVSGPEGFVNYLAGPKKWSGGKECQGPLGGLIGGLSREGWDVQKL
jgi:hypothetical protein